MSSRIDAVADLRLDLDGVQARLVGSGSRLHLDVARPVEALKQIRPLAAGRSSRELLANTARRLDDAGLTIDVVSSDVTLFSVGAGQYSRWASVLAGTPHVSAGAARPVLTLLATSARNRLRNRRHRRR